MVEAGGTITPAELASRVRMRPESVRSMLNDLQQRGAIYPASGTSFVHRDVVSKLARRAVEALDAFHEANPKRLGLADDELRVQLDADKAVLELVLQHLAEQDAIERSRGLTALAGRTAMLSPADQELCDRIERTLRAAHLTPPSPNELAETLDIAADRVRAMLQLLIDRGEVIGLDEKVYMHVAAVQAGRQVALGLFAEANAFETVGFRDALGVSRKYAVPLLDYFDTVRLTVRSGSRRRPGAAAKEAMKNSSSE